MAACGKESKAPEAATPAPAAAPAKASLGIRPNGDTELQIDMSQIHNDDLKKVYQYIDSHIDDHVVNLQKWIQQPSISNTGEGIQESAEMVKGFWDQLGCQQTQVYDVGTTEWGAQGNPVVYAKCDEGAKKTLVIYWMYDTMPISQPDLWKAPPFEGRIVEQPPYKKVLIGRGAINSKGPEMAFWNTVMSIKAVTGKLPVNLIIVAEGDEERMDIGYRKFVKTHPDLFKDADAMYLSGGAGIGGGSEGCVYFELTTSGKLWGRGPTYSNIHGVHKREVDSPAWRHIQMLSTLVSKDGNHVEVPGFYDNIEPLKKVEEDKLKEMGSKFNLKVAAENIGVARFISDDPNTVVHMARYGTSFNLDGIWGGNMFPGGSGAILPNEITSKHNIRYVPNQNGMDIVAKTRKYLDSEGYSDVKIHVVGDVPWAKMRYDTDIAHSVEKAFDAFGIKYQQPIESDASILGGYWPAYLFAGDPINIPIASGAANAGGGAHAANEYYVIEGAGKTYGMAGSEKSIATVLYNFAGLNGQANVADAKSDM
ncbi:M20/M25/M40 family metallo-hydrolase [Solimonas marina]|nr:M20/M25/M40 family metallo-hydrolase [Solimonas marina]